MASFQEIGWFLVESLIRKLPEFLKNRLDFPFWFIEKYHKIVKIHKTDGSLATVSKNLILRPNYKALTEFVHSRIRADGEISNFKLDSKLVSSEKKQKIAGEYFIRETFVKNDKFDKDEILKRGELIESNLSYDLKDSFPKEHECSSYDVCYPTLEAVVEIYFPEGRPARNQKVFKYIGAKFQELSKHNLSQDGYAISWKGKKLNPGERYVIEWDW